MKRLSTLAAGLLIGATAFQYSNLASGQSEGGWITLLDSTKMGDWNEVGKANWAMKDGALTADKLDGKAGMKTRSALGAYQKSAGLKVDCWPSEAVLRSIGAAR